MKRFILPLWLASAGSAFAACNPAQAPIGSPGCQTVVASMTPATDTLLLWQPSNFPASAVQILPGNLSATANSITATMSGMLGWLTGTANPNPTSFTGAATFGVGSGGSGTGLTVNNQLVSGPIVTTGTNTITVGSGGSNHIVLSPVTGSAPLITATGSNGLTINTQGTSQPVNINAPWTQNITVAWSGTTTPNGLLMTQTFTGSMSSSATLNTVTINDSLDASTFGSTSGLHFIHNYGGGTTKGGRQAVDIALVQQGGANADSGSDDYYNALRAQAFARYTQPGSSPTNPIGRVFGFNAFGEIQAGFTATNYYQVAGGEIDVGIIGAGSSSAIRTGLTIADLSGTAQGFWGDNMLWFYTSGNAPAQFRYGIMYGDSQPWPMDANVGTMFGAKMSGASAGSKLYLTKWGVDLVQVAFPSTGNPYDGGVLRSNGITIDGAGTIRQGACYHTPGSTGESIDCKGSVGASAATATQGSGYISAANEIFTTQYGGLWSVTTNVSGVPTGTPIQLSAPAYPSTTPPANPVAAISQVPQETGTGLTFNIAWNTTATTLALNPSGGATTVGGSLTAVSYKVGATAGVSCPANTVSLTTLAITNGIVIHC